MTGVHGARSKSRQTQSGLNIEEREFFASARADIFRVDPIPIGSGNVFSWFVHVVR